MATIKPSRTITNSPHATCTKTKNCDSLPKTNSAPAPIKAPAPGDTEPFKAKKSSIAQNELQTKTAKKPSTNDTITPKTI